MTRKRERQYEGHNFRATHDKSINLGGHDSEGYRMNVLKEFIKLKPPAFEGQPDPLAAERWLESVKTMLDSMGVVNEYRVEFTTYLFEGPAEEWWDVKGDLADLNWEEFETLFRETYAPETLKHDMIAELGKLVQRNMTVSQYHARFLELSCYDPLIVAEPVSKCVKFRRGLTRKIKSKLEPFTFAVLDDLVNAAQSVETYLERKKDKGDRGFGIRDRQIRKKCFTDRSSRASTTRNYKLYEGHLCRGLGNLKSNRPHKQSRSAGGKLRVVTKSPLNSPAIAGKSKTRSRSKNYCPCHGCGRAGNGTALTACRQPNSSLAVGRRKSSSRSGFSESRTTVCHRCHEVGHKQRDCPRQQVRSVLSVGGQSRDQFGSVFEGNRVIQAHQPSALSTPMQSLGYPLRYLSQNQPQSFVFQLNQNVASANKQWFYPGIGGSSFNNG